MDNSFYIFVPRYSHLPSLKPQTHVLDSTPMTAIHATLIDATVLPFRSKMKNALTFYFSPRTENKQPAISPGLLIPVTSALLISAQGLPHPGSAPLSMLQGPSPPPERSAASLSSPPPRPIRVITALVIFQKKKPHL